MKHSQSKPGNNDRLILRPKPKAKSVRIDVERLSEKSRRSYLIHFAPDNYEDIHYQCRHCGKAALFSAEDQKRSFEDIKAHISQQRVLCLECWRRRKKIEREIGGSQARWSKGKNALQHDETFLSEWLSLLETHPKYGGRRNSATIAMLKKQLTPRKAP